MAHPSEMGFKIAPEVIPLVVNCGMLLAYARSGQPGKILYWLGAVLLTLGLLKMKG